MSWTPRLNAARGDERLSVPGDTQQGRRGSAVASFALCPPPRARSLPQEEILEHELAFPSGKRAAASTARYPAIIRLRSGFDFDDLIERIAVRAREWIERRWPAAHGYVPIRTGLVIKRMTASRNCHAIVTPHNHAAAFGNLPSEFCPRNLDFEAPGRQGRFLF
jgi:hypothetical protein